MSSPCYAVISYIATESWSLINRQNIKSRLVKSLKALRSNNSKSNGENDASGRSTFFFQLQQVTSMVYWEIQCVD